MANHRIRLRIGTKEDGSPIIRWIPGKSSDELNDNIARAYVEHNLLDGLLSKEERKALAFHLLETVGIVTDEDRLLRPIQQIIEPEPIPVKVEDVHPEQVPPQIEKKPAPATEHGGITFMEYTETWFKTYKEGKLKPTTLSGYKSNLKRHIYPAIGHLHFDEITTDTIQQFLTDRQDLARNTLHTMLVLISEVLDSAVEDELLPKNPAASKRLFIPSDKKNRRPALSLEELKDVIRQLQEVKDPLCRRMLALMLFTGMRRGEVLGLRWEDIDFENGMITVNRAVTYSPNQPIVTTPKTSNGVRTIPLNPQLKEFLEPCDTKGYILGGDKPLTKMVFTRVFKDIQKAVDLHGATPHVFRHSYLSMLNQAGVDPKTIQRIGGHGNFMLTYNLYVHSSDEQIMDADKRVTGLLTGKMKDEGKHPASLGNRPSRIVSATPSV